MWTRDFKCSLAAIFFTCVFFIESDIVSANAYDGISASALSGAGTYQNPEDISNVHDKHKGIRSYDGTGFPHDSNRDVKSYGTPSRHGVSHDHGIKDHSYNKNDGCSKCKWENDDYWERDEPEEEGDENDGDECDDGQYRPDKTHHRGPGHRPGSRPAGVLKTGPVGVYVDDGAKRDGSGPLGGINYPGTATLKPGSGWNNPATSASKPGSLGTTPNPWSNWNRGTTPSGLDGGYGGRYPSSQKPGASIPNFGTTLKPGQGWNQFPSGPSAVSYAGSGVSPPGNYKNPQESQNKPYEQPGTQSTYAGAYAGASATSSIGSSDKEPPIFGRKDHPFGLYKPNIQTPQGPYGGTNKAPSDSGFYSSEEDNNKPAGSGPTGSRGFDTRTTPHAGVPTLNTGFGTTKTPFSHVNVPSSALTPPYDRTKPKQPGYGIASSSAIASAGASAFGTSNVYTTPSVIGTNAFYSTTPAYNIGSSYTPGIKGNTRPAYGTHPNIKSNSWSERQPESNTGPWSSEKPEDKIPDRYSPGFTGILPGKQSPDGSGTWPDQVQPGHGSGITPERRPPDAGGFLPGKQSPDGSGTWPGQVQPGHGSGITPERRPPGAGGFLPGKQSPDGSGTWPGQVQPGHGSGITPERRPPGVGEFLPGKQSPDGGGTWPGQVQPGHGSGITPERRPPGAGGFLPGKQSPDGGGTWPGQVQPGHGSTSGCSSGNCDVNIPQESSNCEECCKNYNCNSGCNEKDNVPGTHKLCGEAVGPQVNKTYYPAGVGDGNVPNIGTVYKPDSYPNIGIAYPGAQDGNAITQKPWNTANPFLYQSGSVVPNSFSHPWTEATEKPLGKGNPFLDSSWNSPKPVYNNIYNDRNVIPYGEGNIKPTNSYQGNPFLDGNSGKGNVGSGPNEDVSPLEGKIPKGNNPFLTPLVSSSGSVPGNFPTLGTPGSYPGSKITESGNNEGVKGSHGTLPQNRNKSYPAGSNPQDSPLNCKLGLFGCGTSGSGSYASSKYPESAYRGNVESGNPGSVGNAPGSPGENNLAASTGGAQAKAYAGSFSSSQASSSAQASGFAGSFSGVSGSNNYGGNLFPNGAQNQGTSNSWASSGAFASSSAGSWSGSRPTDVKG